MNKQSILAAIFDFDGLIVDIEGMFDQVVQRYAQKMTDQIIPEPNFSDLRRSMLGRKKEESEALLYSELGLDPDQIADPDKYLIWRQPVLKEMFKQAQLLPGARKIIAQLHQTNLPLAIATSSTREDLELKCTLHPGLLDNFSAIITGDQVEKGKPDPELFIRAADALNTPLADCVVFEDAPNGVEAALNGQAGLIVAVPDKRADNQTFLDLQTQAKPDQVIILSSLTDFKPADYQL